MAGGEAQHSGSEQSQNPGHTQGLALGIGSDQDSRPLRAPTPYPTPQDVAVDLAQDPTARRPMVFLADRRCRLDMTGPLRAKLTKKGVPGYMARSFDFDVLRALTPTVYADAAGSATQLSHEEQWLTYAELQLSELARTETGGRFSLRLPLPKTSSSSPSATFAAPTAPSALEAFRSYVSLGKGEGGRGEAASYSRHKGLLAYRKRVTLPPLYVFQHQSPLLALKARHAALALALKHWGWRPAAETIEAETKTEGANTPVSNPFAASYFHWLALTNAGTYVPPVPKNTNVLILDGLNNNGHDHNRIEKARDLLLGWNGAPLFLIGPGANFAGFVERELGIAPRGILNFGR